ncbi:MAG: hypothetical protein NTU63_03560 [Candidatus Pacearchaeota archaeon]|nr:hypothetical protein [Candidatus Pacearchaeota archaeon]
MEKEFIIQLSSELFKVKTDIERELQRGNKTNERLYALILKAINFLKEKRTGLPISKSLPVYHYYENKYGITNLFMIKLTQSSRGFYTNVSGGQFKILQIILEVEETHKGYERKGHY